MSAAVKDKDLGYKAFRRLVQNMDREILVGIRADEGAVKPEGSDATIAEYATYNEFGTSNGVPERSFLRSTVDEKREKYISLLGKAVSRAAGEDVSIDDSLALIGEVAVGDVQTKIREGEFVPNSPETIARKGSSKPLIEHGVMRAAISYEIRKRDGQ